MKHIAMKETTNNLTKLHIILHKLIDKNRNYAINVTFIDNEVSITVINGNKIKRFKGSDIEKLLENLSRKFKGNINGLNKTRQ